MRLSDADDETGSIEAALQTIVKEAIREANEEGLVAPSDDRASGRGILPLLVVAGAAIAIGYVWGARSESAEEVLGDVREQIQDLAFEVAERVQEMSEEVADRMTEGGEEVGGRIAEGSEETAERLEERGEEAAERIEEEGEEVGDRTEGTANVAEREEE